MTSILNSMVKQGDATFYTAKYRQMIEDHLIYLRSNKTLTSVDLAPMVSFKYAADFYGLLFHLNVSMEYHYAVLRLNGYRNPTDFQGTELSVTMIDIDIIRRLVNTMKTQAKKSNK